jgi:ABC-2 type transport system ATP-binding protein
MNRGKLIALDTPANLRESLREPLLEVRTSDSTRAVEALQGEAGIAEVGLFGRALHATLRDGESVEAARARLPALLAERGIQVESVEPIRPSLEDVFVALVEKTGGAVVD